MKRICSIIISLLITGIAFSQPSITPVFVPQYMQGTGNQNAADDRKVPFACRLTINGLTANATYRYYNKFVADPNSTGINGDGNYIIVKQSDRFYRVTAASLSGANKYGEFKTDANGSYTGWFAGEANTELTFAPGNKVYVRIITNNGSGGSGVVNRITASSSPITVINFGNGASANTGTGIRSTPAASGTARNFVMLYDNTTGAGRPLAGTFIESDTTDNTVANGYVPFYESWVNGVEKAWGTIIPNNLPNGIQKIVQYSLATGNKVGSKTSASGSWAKEGGGTFSTVNYNGADILVIDGAAVPLSPPAAQTITFNDLAKKYGDVDFDPGATTSSGLPVTYVSSNTGVATILNGNTVHIVGAGTTDITATQAGDDDFTPATDVLKTLTVNKSDLTVKADKKYWVLGTTMPQLTVSYTGFVYGEDEHVLAPRPQIVTPADASSPLGSYLITVSGAGSPNYNFIYESDTIHIVPNKQSQQITFTAFPGKVYGDADFSPVATASSKLPVTFTSSDPNVATYDAVNNKIHIVREGTTIITASQIGDQNYQAAQNEVQVLTVNKAIVTIKAIDTIRLVGQSNPTFRLTYTGFVNGENKSVLTTQPSVTTTAPDNSIIPGTFPIEVKNAAAVNYDFSYMNGTLTVSNKLPQTISYPALPVKKYGEADFKAGAKASSGLAIVYTSSNANVATIVNDSMIHMVGVGSADITASQPGNTIYDRAANVIQTLTVQKPVLVIKANNQTKNEGQANPQLTVTYSGFVNNDDSSKLANLPIVTTGATANSMAGTYTISVEGAVSPNYTIRQQNGTLTVLPPQGEGQDNLYAYVSSPGQLQVNVYAANVVKVYVQLFDGNGTRLVNTPVTLVKGFNTYRIPIGNLTAGIYNVRVAGNELMQKTKVIIR
ncbi:MULTISPECIES: MBG domain-containing protein [Niastella]|uniref:MBG domain-containing protein n=1 Tax=Niastella soli TaxID=2821487 RepID=A0ABS3Z565_9BACT|nr:MBG domain-containing protein [Niastella soli]MBO9205183.1 hypothetical protein [Niastella soli]